MIEKEILKYRLDRLVYSQNMLAAWKRDKKEFIDKYIKHIFWSDDSQIDRDYEENMSYGRDFHLMCQRIFLGIEPIRPASDYDKKLDKVRAIYRAYLDRYGDNIVFLPEYSLELRDRIQVTYDLLVKVYKDDSLVGLHIWDWKTEKRKIEKNYAENRMQTRVYMYVCKESVGLKLGCSDISMHYYQPAMDNHVIIEYSEDKHEANRHMIYSTIDEIRSLSIEEV